MIALVNSFLVVTSGKPGQGRTASDARNGERARAGAVALFHARLQHLFHEIEVFAASCLNTRFRARVLDRLLKFTRGVYIGKVRAT